MEKKPPEEFNSEQFNPERFNESMLKTTAITFSLEGISRDLETYIQKQITFNNRNFKHLSTIIRSLSACGEEVQKNFFSKRGSLITRMLEQSLDEQENINTLLTFIIQRIISKETNLSDDLEEKSIEKEN